MVGKQVKVLIYAYATGTFYSRKLAAKRHEDVALRVPVAVWINRPPLETNARKATQPGAVNL